jgi:hypothetical protein
MRWRRLESEHLSDDGDRLPPRVAGALAAAEIPPSKLGPARRARLTDSERDLYFWILRSFATSGRLSGAEIRDEAGRLGLDVGSTFESLAQEDLVHLGFDGETPWLIPSPADRRHTAFAFRVGTRPIRCVRSMRSESLRCSTRRSRSPREIR